MRSETKIRSIPTLSVVAAIVTIFYANASLAGGSGGHGGGFVACRDDAGKLESLELADVYEARVHGWLRFNGSSGAVGTYFIDRAFSKRVPRWMSRDVTGAMDWLDRDWSARTKDAGDHAPPPASDDVTRELLKSLALPRECEFIQAAWFFDHPNTITWNWAPFARALGPDWSESEYIVMMKRQILYHEGFYKVIRDRCGDVDSRRTRRIVALILSDYVGPADHWDSFAETDDLFTRGEDPNRASEAVVQERYRRRRRRALGELSSIVGRVRACRDGHPG